MLEAKDRASADDESHNKCKGLSRIADVQLAFSNADLIKKLEARANALKKGDFPKSNDIEEELTKMKNADGKLD